MGTERVCRTSLFAVQVIFQLQLRTEHLIVLSGCNSLRHLAAAG